MPPSNFLETNFNKFLYVSTLFLLIIFVPRISLAAPAYDYVTGSWSDTFSDNTGLSAKTGTDVNVGALELTNSGGTFTAPYLSSGSATSSVVDPIPWGMDYVNPYSIAHYNNLTINATIPANTSATVQILNPDGFVVDNSTIPGNSTGISLKDGANTIDISAYNSGPPTSGAKIFFLYLKVNLSTSDTSVTPSINDWSVTWTTQEGDLSSATLTSSAWPITGHDPQGTFRSQYVGPAYPTFKYFKQISDALGTMSQWGSAQRSNIIIDNLNHVVLSSDNVSLKSLDKTNGNTIWTAPKIYGYYGWDFVAYNGLSAASNGSLYFADIGNDFVAAVDSLTGLFKVAKRTNTGHQFGEPMLSGNLGKLFWLEEQGYTGANIASLISSNFDLSKNWGEGVSLQTNDLSCALCYSFSSIVLSPDESKLYFSYNRTNPAYYPNYLQDMAEGAIYAYNTSDGSLAWTYDAGQPMGGKAFVGSDGTIYTASSYTQYDNVFPPPSHPVIYAINPDGTLKWSYAFSGTDYILEIQSLGSNALFGTVTDNSSYSKAFALNASDGSLLWEKNINFYSYNGKAVYHDNISDADNNSFIEPFSFGTASVALQKLDSNGNTKWSINYPNSGAKFAQSGPIIDENGDLLATSASLSSSFAGLADYTNWTLTATTDKAVYNAGDTVNFEAISNMPRINPITSGANKVEVYFADGSKSLLSYNSIDGSGNTHWTGTYTIPSDSSPGTQTFTIEASQDNISTDIATHFDSPPANSNNTGLTYTGTIQIFKVFPSPSRADWSLTDGKITWQGNGKYVSTSNMDLSSASYVSIMANSIGVSQAVTLTAGWNNYISLPRTNSYTDAASLLSASGANSASYNDLNGNAYQYNGSGTNFPVSSSGVLVNNLAPSLDVGSTSSFTITGQDQPGHAIQLYASAPGAGQDVSLPFHLAATDAAKLFADIPNITAVKYWDNNTSAYLIYDGASNLDNFPISPGMAVTVKVSQDTLWTPTFASSSLSYPASATLTSSTYTTSNADTTWGPLSYDATVPANTSLTFEISTDGGVTWQTVTDPANQSFSRSTTIAFRVTLSSANGASTPILRNVSIAYTVPPTGGGSLPPAGGGGGGGGGGSYVPPSSSSTPGIVSTPTTPSVPGCVAGYLFSSLTGEPCASNMAASSNIPGCGERTTGYSSETGVSCTLNAPHTPIVTTPVTTPSTVSTATYDFGIATLRLGNKGSAVIDLQKFLNAKLNLNLIPDGIFGAHTLSAVKEWQKNHNLTADGVVGPKTKATLNP